MTILGNFETRVLQFPDKICNFSINSTFKLSENEIKSAIESHNQR